MSFDTENIQYKLKEELEKLRHEYKVTLPKEIAEARELGDLKENAGYHAARERMGFVQGKIAQLSEQLALLNSINKDEISPDSVGFGSNVIVEDKKNDFSREITFVTEGEIDSMEGKITLATPWGRALTGKKVDEVVEVVLPAGTKNCKITYLKTIHGNEYGKK